jgi:predicted HD superfamily hydrolase involved in NAD metabolism
MAGDRPLNLARPAFLERTLRSRLTPGRFAHTVSTAHLAAELAQRHGGSPERAYLTGLLHDCGRDLSPEQLHRLLKKYRGRYLDPETRATPALWHNPAAAYLAVHTYGVRDSGILRAIARHSTGAPDMHTLDKIIYVADYSERLRKYPEATRIRALAIKDLDAAVAAVTLDKVRYLQKYHASIHSRTLGLAEKYGIKIDHKPDKRRVKKK